MIIWHGKGGLLALIAFLSLLFMEYTTESYFKDESYYQTRSWPMAGGFFLAGILTFVLAKYLGSNSGRVMIDKETNQEVVIKPKHSLFFVDILYWPIIFGVIGIAILILK